MLKLVGADRPLWSCWTPFPYHPELGVSLRLVRRNVPWESLSWMALLTVTSSL